MAVKLAPPRRQIFEVPATCDAQLKQSDDNLELLCDLDMHFFIEKGFRGRISIANTKR